MINAFRIARRELRGGVRGFRVFLACLALGVGAIAAVGSIASSVISGLEEDGAILLGGDAALRTCSPGAAMSGARSPIRRCSGVSVSASAEKS